MGRPRIERSSGAVARRQSDLKIMCGTAEKIDPPPFNPGFMNNVSESTDIINPNERMTKDELKDFIDNFKPYSGQVFDDPAVNDTIFSKVSKLFLGMIDGRVLVYLTCIDKISDLTIDEFTEGVMSPTRKHQVVVSETIDLIAEWMNAGILKGHRLTPNEGPTGRKDYSIHGEKKLELTDSGKKFLFVIHSSLPRMDEDMVMNAVVRREMYIQRLRKGEKKKVRKEKMMFSEDSINAIAKMKKLLEHK